MGRRDPSELRPAQLPSGRDRARRAWLDHPWVAWAAVVAAALIVTSPLQREVMDDGFPLSTYPMFVEPRLEADVHRAFVRTGPDARRALDPAQIVGSGEEPMAAAMALLRAEKRRKRARRLCTEIATRLRSTPELANVADAHVELVVERWAPIAYYAQAQAATKPASSKVFARCPVHASSSPREAK